MIKCFGYKCPLKKTCYRYTALDSDYHQAYFSEPPFKKNPDEFPRCDYFLEDKKNELRSRKS